MMMSDGVQHHCPHHHHDPLLFLAGSTKLNDDTEVSGRYIIIEVW